jgi:1-deoxy-D-xylulose-5-phosphate reductoisomerase
MSLSFAPPDRGLFPCLDLAYRALRAGGTLPAVLNAANEAAVAAFLDARLPFLEIASTVAAAMDEHENVPDPRLDDILAADAWARQHAAGRMAIAVR